MSTEPTIDAAAQVATLQVLEASAALAGEGLVNAFGHVSVRHLDAFLITPPVPLATLTRGSSLLTVPLDGNALPGGVPAEAWLHASIYRSRPEVGAVVRAQPAAAAVLAASGRPLRALHGQGVLAGRQVPAHPDARLTRSRAAGDAAAASLGAAASLLLRGNGAVTTGQHPGVAVARMWALEASATVNVRLLHLPDLPGLSADEVEHWESVTDELLERLWGYLRSRHPLAQQDPGAPATH